MWKWLSTTRGKRMIKGITIGTLATVVTLLMAWGGAMFSFATVSERVERSREDITELQRAMKDQTGLLHKIDNSLGVLDARVAEHVRATQGTAR